MWAPDEFSEGWLCPQRFERGVKNGYVEANAQAVALGTYPSTFVNFMNPELVC